MSSFFSVSSSSETFSTVSKSGERLYVTQKMIDDLKRETSDLQSEKVKLRSKIVRMRQLSAKREQSISRVLKQSKEKQIIQTASVSTLQNLKKTLDMLVHSKENDIEQLRALKLNDSYWRSSELEVEIRSLFQEQKRLEEEHRLLALQSNDIREKLDYMYDVIGSITALQSEIEEANQKIIELNEKLQSYRHYQQRETKRTSTHSLDELTKQINNMGMKISIEELATKKSDQNCETAIQELDKIIKDLAQRIRDKVFVGKKVKNAFEE